MQLASSSQARRPPASTAFHPCAPSGAICQTTKQGHRNEQHKRRRERAGHYRCLRQLLRRHRLRPDGRLTADEERRLRNVLAALRDYGFIPAASFEPALPGCGFGDVVDHLRASVGVPFADAALAASGRSVPSIEPPPAAVMPVWAFEPDGGSEDPLLSSARLWGTDLLVARVGTSPPGSD
jgi:hypothetical protein